MDLSDPRSHTKRIQWRLLVVDGYDPQQVLLAAQKQGLWRLAQSAKHRLENERLEKTPCE